MTMVRRQRDELLDDDRQLITRAKAGDVDALSQLLARHGAAVRRSLRRHMPSRYRSLIDDDDVMQETYAEAYLGVAQFRCDASFEVWLTRIAQNNLRDAIRGLNASRREGSHRRVVANHGDTALALLDLISDRRTTPSRALARTEVQTMVNDALRHLPDAYRAVVRLYDLDGRPADQVAAVLEISRGAVFMRRARALEMLRDLLDDNGGDAAGETARNSPMG